MPRKMNPVAKLLAIYDTLSETEQAIAFDLLRSKQKPRRAKATKKPKAMAAGAGVNTDPNDQTLNS